MRCLLFFPGTQPDLYEKAIASGADQVCMDLEDAVAPESKDGARDAATSLLARATIDPARFVLRINNPSTSAGDRDLATLGDLEAVRGQSLTLMIPKVAAPEEVDEVHARLDGRGISPSVIAVIETARGLARVEEIAASTAVSGLLFGGLDLSVDLGAAVDWDALLYARSRVVHAARLGGVDAVDMPFFDIADQTGLREEADAVRRLGFKGKAAIHPSQVGVLHDAFSPSEAEVAQARLVTETFDREGKGVFLLDGVMVDRPAIEAARRVVAWADAHER